MFNLILYGDPESSSVYVPQRIAHDRLTCCSILESFGDVIPINSKLMRLGKVREDSSARPLKIIFDDKDTAVNLLLQFNTANRSGSSFSNEFRMAIDKTALQYKLLRLCHAKLDNRAKNGESGLLRIGFINGVLKVSATVSKNGIMRQRRSSQSVISAVPNGVFITGLYQYCRGHRSKLTNFKFNVSAFNCIFLILTETWLTIYFPIMN